MLPDLPWFVYAMLLAPLGLLLVTASSLVGWAKAHSRRAHHQAFRS